MTANIVEHKKIENLPATAVGNFFREMLNAKNNQGTNFDFQAQERAYQKDEADKLLSMLQSHADEKDGWQRSMGATVALLNYAHKMIDQAEEKLKLQEQRICELETLSSTDELTGLTNRRGFFDTFMREMDRCGRGLNKGGLLIMIDLDNFKMINDTYGHMAGDASLRLVARTLENQIRTMDVAARLGGDEFILLLTNTTKQDAAGRAQKLAWNLNHLTLAWHGEEIPVRASLGIRAYDGSEKPDEIFNEADMALYDQKARRKADAKADTKAGKSQSVSA